MVASLYFACQQLNPLVPMDWSRLPARAGSSELQLPLGRQPGAMHRAWEGVRAPPLKLLLTSLGHCFPACKMD